MVISLHTHQEKRFKKSDNRYCIDVTRTGYELKFRFNEQISSVACLVNVVIITSTKEKETLSGPTLIIYSLWLDFCFILPVTHLSMVMGV